MKERIVQLAVAHQIVTQYTSFVVVEERTGDRRASGQPDTRVVPVNAPAGWAMFGTDKAKAEEKEETTGSHRILAADVDDDAYGQQAPRKKAKLAGATGGRAPGAPPPPMAARPAPSPMPAPARPAASMPPAPSMGPMSPEPIVMESAAELERSIRPRDSADSRGGLLSRLIGSVTGNSKPSPSKGASADLAQGKADTFDALAEGTDAEMYEPSPEEAPAAEPMRREQKADSGQDAGALLASQLASGLWAGTGTGPEPVRQARATAMALLELLRQGITSNHALHGAQVKKAVEALLTLAAQPHRRARGGGAGPGRGVAGGGGASHARPHRSGGAAAAGAQRRAWATRRRCVSTWTRSPPGKRFRLT